MVPKNRTAGLMLFIEDGDGLRNEYGLVARRVVLRYGSFAEGDRVGTPNPDFMTSDYADGNSCWGGTDADEFDLYVKRARMSEVDPPDPNGPPAGYNGGWGIHYVYYASPAVSVMGEYPAGPNWEETYEADMPDWQDLFFCWVDRAD
jgi:hypothetical protein